MVREQYIVFTLLMFSLYSQLFYILYIKAWLFRAYRFVKALILLT